MISNLIPNVFYEFHEKYLPIQMPRREWKICKGKVL